MRARSAFSNRRSSRCSSSVTSRSSLSRRASRKCSLLRKMASLALPTRPDGTDLHRKSPSITPRREFLYVPLTCASPGWSGGNCSRTADTASKLLCVCLTKSLGLRQEPKSATSGNGQQFQSRKACSEISGNHMKVPVCQKSDVFRCECIMRRIRCHHISSRVSSQRL